MAAIDCIEFDALERFRRGDILGRWALTLGTTGVVGPNIFMNLLRGALDMINA